MSRIERDARFKVLNSFDSFFLSFSYNRAKFKRNENIKEKRNFLQTKNESIWLVDFPLCKLANSKTTPRHRQSQRLQLQIAGFVFVVLNTAFNT